jgi:transposase InsO family protein
VLRTDNDGELCGKEFDQFCKQYGISRQNTIPYTPHQNGVADIMNKTLMDKAMRMLSGVAGDVITIKLMESIFPQTLSYANILNCS